MYQQAVTSGEQVWFRFFGLVSGWLYSRALLKDKPSLVPHAPRCLLQLTHPCHSAVLAFQVSPGFSLGLQALLEKPFHAWRWPAANGSIPLLPASQIGPCSQRVHCLLPTRCLTQQGASTRTQPQRWLGYLPMMIEMRSLSRNNRLCAG